MNKLKLILAVVIFTALIFAGIVLPLILRKDPSDAESTEETLSETSSVMPQTIDFLKFDDLKLLMADINILQLKALFHDYLSAADYQNITDITYLSDQISYPDTGEVQLLFQLSDGTKLPVFYDSIGHFFFGPEKMLLSDQTKLYKKPTDDSLPKVTTQEIEQMPEGGCPDPKTVDASSKKNGGE